MSPHLYVYINKKMKETMEYLHSKDSDPKSISDVANKVLEDLQMNAIRDFLREGEKHGTVVEALYIAMGSLRYGESDSIIEALNEGASEWYK